MSDIINPVPPILEGSLVIKSCDGSSILAQFSYSSPILQCTNPVYLDNSSYSRGIYSTAQVPTPEPQPFPSPYTLLFSLLEYAGLNTEPNQSVGNVESGTEFDISSSTVSLYVAERKNLNLVVQDGDVLLDLTQDTVETDTLVEGVTAHDCKGKPIVGTHVCQKVSSFKDAITQPSTCYCLAVGNDKFVAFPTTKSKGYYSSDGKNWSSFSLSNSAGVTCVCFGNGRFVGLTTNSNALVYSDDGTTWTVTTHQFSSGFATVVYAQGKFVAVNYGGQSAYSLDGVTWVSGGSTPINKVRDITYGKGMFVVICDQGSCYSEDGITWYEGHTTSQIVYSSVTYGKGIFVACGTGKSGTTTTKYGLAYSTDGKHFYTVSCGYSVSIQDVVEANGIFVAVSYGRVFVSTDGRNWTSVATNGGSSIEYMDGVFATVSQLSSHPARYCDVVVSIV